VAVAVLAGQPAAATVSELVEWIRAQGNARLLLAQHAATADGRCRTCKAGGASSGHEVFPCSTWTAAHQALDRPSPEQGS
jgi:hypothetical protein